MLLFFFQTIRKIRFKMFEGSSLDISIKCKLEVVNSKSTFIEKTYRIVCVLTSAFYSKKTSYINT